MGDCACVHVHAHSSTAPCCAAARPAATASLRPPTHHAATRATTPGVASWDWFYPYHYAPMAQDMRQLGHIDGERVRLCARVCASARSQAGSAAVQPSHTCTRHPHTHLQHTHATPPPAVSFTRGRPFRPFEQLLAVLPSASASLLAPAYQWLMTQPNSPIVDFYPEVGGAHAHAMVMCAAAAAAVALWRQARRLQQLRRGVIAAVTRDCHAPTARASQPRTRRSLTSTWRASAPSGRAWSRCRL
jgi:hypothetical protein